MKLRLQSSSVRLRLSDPEVRKLASDGRLSESVQFGGDGSGPMTYEILASEEAREVSAAFRGGRLTVSVPRASLEDWAASGDIALSSEAAGREDEFRIIIEKDLARRRPERA